jgi:HK97 family phage prohead protease
MQIRSFDYEIKAVNDDGLFSGYGSVFGVVDSYNEIVAPGAFAKSLDDVRSKGRTFPVLWQHRSGEPIGNWHIATMKEDSHGLAGTGSLWLDDAPYAKVAYRGMQTKAITGLSIGYRVRADSFDEKTRIRTLKEVELVEISIVTNPANDDARIDAVKAMIASGNLPTIKEFEQILREAGFSKSQAAVIANRGLSHLLRSESEEKANTEALIQRIQSFSLPKF